MQRKVKTFVNAWNHFKSNTTHKLWNNFQQIRHFPGNPAGVPGTSSMLVCKTLQHCPQTKKNAQIQSHPIDAPSLWSSNTD